MVAATQAAYILNGNLAYAGAPLGYAGAPLAFAHAPIAAAPYTVAAAPAPIAVAAAPAAYAVPAAREIEQAPIVETVSRIFFHRVGSDLGDWTVILTCSNPLG